MDYLTSRIDPVISAETFFNRHVDGQIDTLFTLRFAKDYFKIYKTASENFLQEACIQSETFKTKDGFHVGMTKSEFKRLIPSYELSKIPDYIRLQSFEVLEWIDVVFIQGRIQTIKFSGYVD